LPAESARAGAECWLVVGPDELQDSHCQLSSVEKKGIARISRATCTAPGAAWHRCVLIIWRANYEVHDNLKMRPVTRPEEQAIDLFKITLARFPGPPRWRMSHSSRRAGDRPRSCSTAGCISFDVQTLPGGQRMRHASPSPLRRVSDTRHRVSQSWTPTASS